MDLLRFDGARAIVGLYPADLASLAKLLDLAQVDLVSIEDEPLAEASRTYRSLFQACALGCLAPGWMLGKDQAALREDLAGLGLPELLGPVPGQGAKAAE